MMVYTDSQIIVEKKTLQEQNDFVNSTKEPRVPLVASSDSHPVIEEKVPENSMQNPGLNNQATIDLSSVTSAINKREEMLGTILKVSLITIGVYLIYTKVLK
jgi:hypothetical protein